MGELQQHRYEVYYSGRVQGVGFRYTTVQIARRFDVTGYVQNLSDGRVLLVAEGSLDELKHFLSEIQAELGRNIRDTKSATLAASHEFASFSVRH